MSMKEPTYEMMLGDNLMADEGGRAPPPPSGGRELTANQMSALSARAGVPCGACGAYEPRRLCMNLTALWAFATVCFVLSVTALGVSSSSSGSSSVAKSYCQLGHQGTQLYGEDVYEGPDGCEGSACHHYQVIGGSWAAITWHQAHADAQTRCYEGVQGHLVYVDSIEENEWLESKVKANPSYQSPSHAWLGATDLRSEGEFEWIGGKHSGEVFFTTADGGATLEGKFSNWASGEPNDAAAKEDCVLMDVGIGSLSGLWNDDPCYKPREYFIVEFDV
jgi:hypothetical protein